MQNKNYLSFVVVVIFFVIGFFLVKNNFSENFKYLNIGGVVLKVEVVSTPELRERGFSGRVGLEGDRGMFFVFDYPDKYTFWMKDMNFPIDIIWIDENNKIIYIKKEVSPLSYPETFGPTKNALYVLEVVSGFSQKYNLKEGDSIKFVN